MEQRSAIQNTAPLQAAINLLHSSVPSWLRARTMSRLRWSSCKGRDDTTLPCTISMRCREKFESVPFLLVSWWRRCKHWDTK
ncbi:hypothetical protein I7I50_05197 [Histoplasma capsulatum G186AR]|uniref:Uncharacterized protein n=1 Tax=Ajellomyces capsulatus TaxID=5037 RepID=A0A8H7Z9D2_AJECA|nr:hypothetical protein I7I52_03455 [Histoplasma capsulatum]QSS75905.1 hypothetical protein I7I50_05197 [Histoplasma capsulatum G186AR]